MALITNIGEIPDELQGLNQWVYTALQDVILPQGHELKKKIPLAASFPNAKGIKYFKPDIEDIERLKRGLASIENAKAKAETLSQENGDINVALGFYLLSGGKIVCIDLDHCFNELGEFCGNSYQEKIIELAEKCETFTEFSPSMQGLHIWGMGEWLALVANSKQNKAHVFPGVEIYESLHYMTVTGNKTTFSGDELTDIQSIIDYIASEVKKKEISTAAKETTTEGAQDYTNAFYLPGAKLTADEVIEKAGKAKNCDRFKSLFENGDFAPDELKEKTAKGADISDSAKRISLLNRLSFYTGANASLLADVFSRSQLANNTKWTKQPEKWRQQEIQKAINYRCELIEKKGREGNIYEPKPKLDFFPVEDEQGKELTEDIKKELANLAKYHLSDIGMAERVNLLYGDKIRYCEEVKAFFLYDGQRWVELNEIPRIENLYRAMLKMTAHAVIDSNLTEKDKIIKYLQTTAENSRLIRGAIERLKPLCLISIDEFDKEPYLLNTPDGVINLNTGEIMPHNSRQYMTKITKGRISDATDESRQKVNKFICDILPDKDMRDYISRIFGACCTAYGGKRDKAFFLAQGKGDNGKTSLFASLLIALGSYGYNLPRESFLAAKNDGGAGRPREDLIPLRGCRMAFTEELPRDRYLRMSDIKDVTGGGTISTRACFKGQIVFPALFTLIMTCNELPHTRDFSTGSKGRLRILPFTQNFTGRKDTEIIDYLHTNKAALGAILEKAVEGARLHFMNGKRIEKDDESDVPKEVKKHNADYWEREDIISHFLNDCCEWGRDESDRPFFILCEDIQYAFFEYDSTEKTKQRNRGRELVAQIEERLEKLKDKECKKTRTGGGLYGNRTCFRGVRLKQDFTENEIPV